jgi:site-specific recombinase XerD
LGGQRYDEISLSRIGTTEVETYLNHLKKNYQPTTVKRKLVAIQAFTNWVDTQLGPITEAKEDAYTEAKPLSSGVAADKATQSVTSPSQADTLIGTNRYQAVFALAEQGLDQPDIATQTGLEQESVRMLLTIGAPPQVNH